MNFMNYRISAVFALFVSTLAYAQVVTVDAAFTQLPLIQQGGVLGALGLAGMIAHYLKKWARKEIAGNLVGYLIHDNPRDTLLAVMATAGGIGTAYLMGQFDGVTIKQIIMPAFLIGYAGDSAANKGSAPAV